MADVPVRLVSYQKLSSFFLFHWSLVIIIFISLFPPRSLNSLFTTMKISVDITSVDRRNLSREQETIARAGAICQAFQQSQLQRDIIGNNFSRDTSFLYHHSKDPPVFTQTQSPSWFRVFRCLLE